MPLFFITPVLGWAWPSLVPLAVTVAAGYGYKRLTDTGEKGWMKGKLTREIENLKLVSVPLDDLIADVVGEEVGRDERLIFEREDSRLIFRRDTRGKFFVDALGPKSKMSKVLRQEALAFARDLAQEFVYNRVQQELAARGLNTVAEEVEQDSGDIVLEVRRWH